MDLYLAIKTPIVKSFCWSKKKRVDNVKILKKIYKNQNYFPLKKKSILDVDLDDVVVIDETSRKLNFGQRILSLESFLILNLFISGTTLCDAFFLCMWSFRTHARFVLSQLLTSLSLISQFLPKLIMIVFHVKYFKGQFIICQLN